MRGVWIMDDLTRPLTATLYAKIDRDIDFNDVDVRFDALEEQRTLTKIALHGWRRFNKAAHSLPPYDKLFSALAQSSQKRVSQRKLEFRVGKNTSSSKTPERNLVGADIDASAQPPGLSSVGKYSFTKTVRTAAPARLG